MQMIALHRIMHQPKIRPQPSPDGAYLAFGANVFYDGNAWMIER